MKVFVLHENILMHQHIGNILPLQLFEVDQRFSTRGWSKNKYQGLSCQMI